MELARQVFGLVAAGLTCISGVAYVRAILRRTSSTKWSSWLIWTVASAASLATYYGSGARASAWVPLAYTVGSAVIFVAALWRRSSGGLSLAEWLCLAGAGLGLVVWWVSGSAVIGQVACVVVEVAAYIPIWLTAHEENCLAWSTEAIGSLLNMVAIAHFSFGLLLYPSAMLICNSLVVILMVWRKPTGVQPIELEPSAQPVLASQ